MPVERLTEDLLRHIIAASSPDEYLAEGETVDRSLSDYLFDLLRERGIKARRCRSCVGFASDGCVRYFLGQVLSGSR